MCPTSKYVIDFLAKTVKTVDLSVTTTKLLLLDFEANSNIAENACVWLIVESLSFGWARRKGKKVVNKNELNNTLCRKAKILGLILQMIK